MLITDLTVQWTFKITNNAKYKLPFFVNFLPEVRLYFYFFFQLKKGIQDLIWKNKGQRLFSTKVRRAKDKFFPYRNGVTSFSVNFITTLKLCKKAKEEFITFTLKNGSTSRFSSLEFWFVV